MASSSVSQESLDIEDYETSIRKSKIRNLRARGALPGYKGGDRDADGFEREYGREQNGDHGGEQEQHSGHYGVIPEIHDSPSRSTSAGRAKDKRSRPNHLHKGKLPKDKRKLREKRRSTGVVHLQSTESTGDSLDDDDDGDTKALSEAKRNTSYNEVIDNDNPQTPSEERIPKGYPCSRNKSPSDLEADLEDNQDYDSTVSQSETNLTLIGRADSTESANQSPKYVLGRSSVLSRYSPSESPKSFKPYSPYTSDLELKTPSSTTSTSSSSSVLSRYRYGNEAKWQDTDSTKPFSYDKTRTVKPVSAFVSRYEERRSDGDVNTSYRGYRNRYGDSSVGNAYVNKYTAPNAKDDEKANLEKQLEKEREEIKKLKQVIEEKDKKIEEKDRQIADLQREVNELNRDLDDLDDENQKLQLENNALIRAVSQLSTNV